MASEAILPFRRVSGAAPAFQPAERPGCVGSSADAQAGACISMENML